MTPEDPTGPSNSERAAVGRVGRRSFCAWCGAAALTAPWLAACDAAEPKSCDGPDLPDAVKAEREALAYVDISADRARACQSCRQWLPPSESGGCGSCKVMKGPVHPRGSCKVFAPTG